MRPTSNNNGCMIMHSYPFITDGPKDDSSNTIPQMMNNTETQTMTDNLKEVPPGIIHIKPTWKPVKLDEKPPFSYATIIAHAILSSEERKLTLSEIYQWISEKYPCYSMKDNRWQNSIRHNLSLQKAFVKLERDISSTTISSGKGCHWTILPGYEQQFIDNLLKRGLSTTSTKCSSSKLTAAASHKQFKKIIDNSSKRESSHLFTIFRMNPTTNETTAKKTTPNQIKKRRKVIKKQVVKKKQEDPIIEYDSDCDSGIDLSCEVIAKKEVPAFSTIPDYDTPLTFGGDDISTMLAPPVFAEQSPLNFYEESDPNYFVDMLSSPTINNDFCWSAMQQEQMIDLSTANYQDSDFYSNYVDPSMTMLLQNPSNMPTSFIPPPLLPFTPLYNNDYCF